MPISHVENKGTLKSYKCISVNGKGVRLHRHVMENHLGRKLLTSEIVHHQDGNKWNNDLNNLRITNRSQHAKLHIKEFIKIKNGHIIKCSCCSKERYITCSIAKKTAINYKCRACYRLTSKESNKKKRKPVVVYSINGLLIKRFKGATDASNNLNISRTSIKNCLNRYSKTAGGFVFKYE